MSKVKWAVRQMGELFCSMSPWANLLDSVFSAWLHAWWGVPTPVPWLPSGACLYCTWGVLCHHGYHLTPWRLGGGMEKKHRDRFSFLRCFYIHMVLCFFFTASAKPCQSLEEFWTKAKAVKYYHVCTFVMFVLLSQRWHFASNKGVFHFCVSSEGRASSN